MTLTLRGRTPGDDPRRDDVTDRRPTTTQERAAELQALTETDLVALSDAIYGSSEGLALRRDDHVCAILDHERGHRETLTVYPGWGARIEEIQEAHEARQRAAWRESLLRLETLLVAAETSTREAGLALAEALEVEPGQEAYVYRLTVSNEEDLIEIGRLLGITRRQLSRTTA